MQHFREARDYNCDDASLRQRDIKGNPLALRILYFCHVDVCMICTQVYAKAKSKATKGAYASVHGSGTNEYRTNSSHCYFTRMHVKARANCAVEPEWLIMRAGRRISIADTARVGEPRIAGREEQSVILPFSLYRVRKTEREGEGKISRASIECSGSRAERRQLSPPGAIVVRGMPLWGNIAFSREILPLFTAEIARALAPG